MEEHKVYHIRLCGNEDVSQGYIGVTSNLAARTRSHKHSKMLCTGREVVVLLSGTKEHCYDKEAELRPIDGLGWNKCKGGYLTAGHIKEGEHRSIFTEIKKGQHLSTATEFTKGMTPHNKGTGKDYLLISPEGEEILVTCLSDFCKANNLTPANIRKVAKGERRYHKGWQASIVITGW